MIFCGGTYESDEEEHDLEAPAQRGDARDVTVTDGRHGHHEEVDALPVRQLLAVQEVGRVARVLQLLVEGRRKIGEGRKRERERGREGGNERECVRSEMKTDSMMAKQALIEETNASETVGGDGGGSDM